MNARIYPTRELYVAHDRAALADCEHGLTRADCDLCTRYAGECDLGGCNHPATAYGLQLDGDGAVLGRRLICDHDRRFARDLGLRIVPHLHDYDQVPQYAHVRHCRWAGVGKWCPSGCAGEPTTYEAAVGAVGSIASHVRSSCPCQPCETS